MNYLTYERARVRRDELLREAAERRLAQHAVAAREAAPSREPVSGPSQLRRFARLRFVVGR
jgi:hypothetical protein